MRDGAQNRALVPGMRLGESWSVGGWLLGEAWRCVGVLRCNSGAGAQQERKLKFGSCKNEHEHQELQCAWKKGLRGYSAQEKGN